MFHCVHIHLILNRINARTTQICCLFDKERFIYIHWLLIHPYQHCFKVTVNNRQVIGMYQHFTTGYINFIFQCQCNRLWRESIVQLTVISHDTLHFGRLSWRQRHYRIPLTNNTRSHLTTKTSKIQIRTQHILHRETKILQIMVIVNMNSFKEIK